MSNCERRARTSSYCDDRFHPVSCFMNASLDLCPCLPDRFESRHRKEPELPRVLVFFKNRGFRHDSIATGLATVRELATDGGFVVDATEDAARIYSGKLGAIPRDRFSQHFGGSVRRKTKSGIPGIYRRWWGLAAVHQGITTLDKWPWYVCLGRRREVCRAPRSAASDDCIARIRDPSRHQGTPRDLALV